VLKLVTIVFYLRGQSQMNKLALLLAILGGICLVLGFLTALEIIPPLVASGHFFGPISNTTIGMGGMSVILLLGCIACLIARRNQT
jgi:uncharacterized membrane protein YuzA (DUF378 family)